MDIRESPGVWARAIEFVLLVCIRYE